MDKEDDLIVADYFAMLADDISARRSSKAEHRRALLPLLNDRSEGSLEFKHQNISAVLKGLGEDWIPGYKRTAIDLGNDPLAAPSLDQLDRLWSRGVSDIGHPSRKSQDKSVRG